MHSIFKRRFLTLVFIVFLTTSGFAQTPVHKFWASIDIKKEYNKWDFTAETEIREDGFLRQMERLSLQTEAIYNLSKIFNAGVSYMIMNFYDYKYNDFQLRHRFQGIVGMKAESGRFEFSIREKGELTTKDEKDRIDNDGETDTYRINPELIWRNKMKIEYDVPNISLIPSVALETFYLLNDPDGNRFEKLRYTLALSYKLNNHNKLEAFGHYNKEMLDGETDSFVTGVGYTYIF